MMIAKYVNKLPLDVKVTFVTGEGDEKYELIDFDDDQIVLRRKYDVTIVPWSSVGGLSIGQVSLPEVPDIHPAG